MTIVVSCCEVWGYFLLMMRVDPMDSLWPEATNCKSMMHLSLWGHVGYKNFKDAPKPLGLCLHDIEVLPHVICSQVILGAHKWRTMGGEGAPISIVTLTQSAKMSAWHSPQWSMSQWHHQNRVMLTFLLALLRMTDRRTAPPGRAWPTRRETPSHFRLWSDFAIQK